MWVEYIRLNYVVNSLKDPAKQRIRTHTVNLKHASTTLARYATWGFLFLTFTPADVQAILANPDGINLGSAYENAVAQELRARGHAQLAYFNSKDVGEVDYLIEDGHRPLVLPVEEKSGKCSRKHAALDKLLAVRNYTIERPRQAAQWAQNE